MSAQRLTTQLLEITSDRSKWLGIELDRMLQRQYPPTGPKLLIQLAISANNQVGEDLVKRMSDPNLPPEPDRRTEIFLRGKTNLLDFLHSLMQCIEGADIQNCPSTFIVPIRRMLSRQLGRVGRTDFDFIVKASRAYNYMIWSIDDDINRVFSEARYPNLIASFPTPFFIIECPISERRNIPIHCIFSHEVGHVWYQSSGLQNILLPIVQSPSDSINQKLIKANWAEELAADAIALCLLGPAFLFSLIYFSGPYCSISHASPSHPPDGLRIQFLCNMLLSNHRQGGLGYKDALEQPNLEYLEQWQTYASNIIRMTSFTAQFRSIMSSLVSALSPIMKETKILTRRYRYSPKIYKQDVPSLCDNIAEGIPPNEIIRDINSGKLIIARAESILNAGWSYLISGDLSYSKLLGIDDRWRITNRLFDLVSKGLEYSEMQRRVGGRS